MYLTLTVVDVLAFLLHDLDQSVTQTLIRTHKQTKIINIRKS